ncbi:hypothetical protein CALCODRAFT_531294 [Calocera cornea HHB12733]|uniref:Uncharacterized protein n=1 Tax=Calocera cornea HHB12733 TaxID=1353952 RepID=A0A165DAA8_9BASI|nr:hypothetical protein CALCODRAFT_531294 [Calocera cornea HHB12733]
MTQSHHKSVCEYASLAPSGVSHTDLYCLSVADSPPKHNILQTTEVAFDSLNGQSPFEGVQTGENPHHHDFVAPNADALSERPPYLTETTVCANDTLSSASQPHVVQSSERLAYAAHIPVSVKGTYASNTPAEVGQPSRDLQDATTDSDTESLLSELSSSTDQEQLCPPIIHSEGNTFRLALAEELRAGFRVITNRGSAADLERMKNMDPRLNLLIHGFKDYREKTGIVPEGQSVDLWAAWLHARNFAQSELGKRRRLLLGALHLTYDDFLDALAPPAYDEADPPPYPVLQPGLVQPHNGSNATFIRRSPQPIKFLQPGSTPLFPTDPAIGIASISRSSESRAPASDPVESTGIDAFRILTWFHRWYTFFHAFLMYG